MRKLVILVERNEPFRFPGHCVVGDEEEFFGFRFDPLDLPPEFQSEMGWRRYLVSNTVPGYIDYEEEFLAVLMGPPRREYWMKEVETDAWIMDALPDERLWEDFADYSFNPQRFQDGPRPCHNCVTWAVETANEVVPGFLDAIPDGRISKLLLQLQQVEGELG